MIVECKKSTNSTILLKETGKSPRIQKQKTKTWLDRDVKNAVAMAMTNDVEKQLLFKLNSEEDSRGVAFSPPSLNPTLLYARELNKRP